MKAATRTVVSGEVKWFDDKKGYGFITSPGLKGDVFVHFSDIITEAEHKTLHEGDRVEFCFEQHEKNGEVKLKASEVIKVQ